MIIRPQFKTEPYKPIPPIREPEPRVWEAQEFLVGLFTEANPEIIPDNALQLIKNAGYFKNQLFRRNGLQGYGLDKPDSNAVLALFAFQDAVEGVGLYRFTESSVYKADSTGWTNFTGIPLTGSEQDSFYFTSADSRAFFSNNGVNPIQELLPASNTYVTLGDTNNFKYLTSAFDRVIAAYETSPDNNPINIAWSGARNYGEWDPSVDISAGNTPLVNSPADLSDWITGLFYIGVYVVVTRQRSLWLATNLPSATQPFNFFQAIPKIGADLPNAISTTEKGLVFYNYIGSTAYYWIPGQEPIEISQQVRRNIKSDIIDPNLVYSSYNIDTKAWSLFIPNPVSGVIKAYVYYFLTQNWGYEEYIGVSTVDDIEFSSSTVSIDELAGTIGGLAGTIDSLGGLVEQATRFFGFSNGDICTQPLTTVLVLTDNGLPFDTNIDSKAFVNQNKDSVYTRLSIGYTPYSNGTLTVEYSKDGGVTFNTYKSISVTSDMHGVSQIVLISKPKRSRKLFFRVTSSDVFFSLDNYHLEADISGLSQTSK